MKKYNTNYKKKVDVERDAYLPKRSPPGIIHCGGCGAVYYRRHWTLTPPPEIRDVGEFRSGVRSGRCPACRKRDDGYPGGELRLIGGAPGEKREILRILRNEEARAREKNPLERIMAVETNGLRGWSVKTTTEKLAQRLGRSLRKARGGSVRYCWSHNNKFVHVFWDKRKEPWEEEGEIHRTGNVQQHVAKNTRMA